MKQKLKGLGVYVVAAVLTVISYFSVNLGTDDFFWICADSFPELQYWRTPNGRYLSNTLAMWMLDHQKLMWLVYIPFVFLLLLVMLRFTTRKAPLPSRQWLVLGIFCLIPPAIWADVLGWISAFPVYVTPMIAVLLYLRTVLREFDGKPLQAKWAAPFFGVIAFAGALCVEHVTLYALLLGAFALIYAGVRKSQKIRAYQICWMIGAAAGAVLMFLNQQYRTIAESGDITGIRRFEFHPSELFYQLYWLVIPHFAKEYWPIHLVIAGAMVLLVIRAKKDGWDKDRVKYVRVTLGIVTAYALYSCITSATMDVQSLSPSMRTAALESAFVFLDIVSVVYLGWVLLDRQAFLRVAVLLCSALICTGVFLVVSPVSARCFFASFCFWLLCAAELAEPLLETCSESAMQILRRTAAVFCVGTVCMLSYFQIVNKIAYDASIRHLKEQMAQGRQTVEIVTLPYAEYTPAKKFIDSMEAISVQKSQEIDPLYGWTACEYYDLPVDPETFSVNRITFFAYNT